MPSPKTTKTEKSTKVAKTAKTVAAKSATAKTTSSKTVKKTPAKTTSVKTTTTKEKTVKATPATTQAAPKATKKTAASKKTSGTKVSEPSDFAEKIRDVALRILDERQAEDVAVFDLRNRSSIADFAIIASGRSGRQLVAITEYLREAFFKLGVRKLRIEGVEQADWVLFDGGDVIIHLFRPEVRGYYNLEEIWAKHPHKE